MFQLVQLRVFHKLVYAQPKEPQKEKEATMKAARYRKERHFANSGMFFFNFQLLFCSKLRAFIKRSSEPLLNMQPQPVSRLY